MTRQEILDIILYPAHWIELDLYYNPRDFDNSSLRDQIKNLQKGYELHPGSEKNRNPAHRLAIARSYERCLGEPGVLDMYRDFSREWNEGNCEEAENIVSAIGDQNERLRVIRNCYSPSDEQNSSAQEEKKERFFQSLEELSEEELVQTANRNVLGLDSEDRFRWISLCDEKRQLRGVAPLEAQASCIADLTIQDAYGEGGLYTPRNLGYSENKIQELLQNVPLDEHTQERRCVLQADLIEQERLREQEHSGRPFDWIQDDAISIYNQCLERK